MEKHGIPPVFDESSRVLILGSFPSVKSRETKFFYGHPLNRFWRVLSAVYGAPCPESVAEKKRLLLDNRVALWDVIAECEITGSGDSSIKNARINDLGEIFSAARIERVFCNGATAHRLYIKRCEPLVGLPARRLPSTSPANAAYSLEKLINEWKTALAQ